jgi:Ca-activated chloride channel homolog
MRGCENSIEGNGEIELSGGALSSRVRGLSFLLLCALLASGQIWRDKVSRKNAEGNALYGQKNYSGALERYVEAQDGRSHQHELAYNLGNTLYQQKKYPEALKEFERAISSENASLNQKLHFNRGNAFFQMGKYEEAVESYKKALELHPADKDAKYNLELALKKLQQKTQDQQKKDSQKQDQQQNKDPKQNQDQKDPSKQADQKNQSSEPQKQPQNPEKPQSSDSKQQPEQKGQQPKPQQKVGMDPKEALRILDALNQQEKQEQRKQALKIQRQRNSGKDW